MNKKFAWNERYTLGKRDKVWDGKEGGGKDGALVIEYAWIHYT